MKPIKTRRQYHDSELVGAEWINERDLILRFRLDGDWNRGTSIEASVMFSAVRNRNEVDQALRAISEAVEHRRWLADVVAIVRDENRKYLVDTSCGLAGGSIVFGYWFSLDLTPKALANLSPAVRA